MDSQDSFDVSLNSHSEGHPHANVFRDVCEFLQEKFAIFDQSETTEYSDEEEPLSEAHPSSSSHSSIDERSCHSVLIQTESMTSSVTSGDVTSMECISSRLRVSERTVESKFHAMDELARKERQDLIDQIAQLKSTLEIAERENEELKEIQSSRQVELTSGTSVLNSVSTTSGCDCESHQDLSVKLESAMVEIQEKNTLIEGYRSELQASQTGFEEWENERLNFKSKIQDLQKKFSREKQEMSRIVEELRSQCRARVEKAEADESYCIEIVATVGRISEKQNGLEEKCLALEEICVELKNEVELRQDGEDTQADRIALLAELHKVESEKEQLAEMLDSLKEEIVGFEKDRHKVEELDKKFRFAEKEAERLKDDLLIAESTNADLMQHNSILSAKITGMDAQLTDFRKLKMEEIDFYSSKLQDSEQIKDALQTRIQQSALQIFRAVQLTSESSHLFEKNVEKWSEALEKKAEFSTERIGNLENIVGSLKEGISAQRDEMDELKTTHILDRQKIRTLELLGVAFEKTTSDLISENENLRALRESSDEEIKKLKICVESDVEAKNELERKLNELSANIETERTEAESGRRKLAADVEEWSGKYSELEVTLKEKDAVVDRLEDELEEAEVRNSDLVAQLNSAKSQSQQLELQLLEKDAEYASAIADFTADFEQSAAESKSGISHLETQLAEVLLQNSALTSCLSEVQESLTKVQEDILIREQVITQLRSDLQNSITVDEHTSILEQLETARASKDGLISENVELKELLEAAREERSIEVLRCRSLVDNFAESEKEWKSKFESSQLENEMEERLEESESNLKKSEDSCHQITEKYHELEIRSSEIEKSLNERISNLEDKLLSEASLENIRDLSQQLSVSEQLKDDLMNQIAVMTVQHTKECEELLAKITGSAGIRTEEEKPDLEREDFILNGAAMEETSRNGSCQKCEENANNTEILMERLREYQDQISFLSNSVMKYSAALRETDTEIAYYQKNILRLGMSVRRLEDCRLELLVWRRLSEDYKQKNSRLEEKCRTMEIASAELDTKVKDLEKTVSIGRLGGLHENGNQSAGPLLSGFGNFHAQLSPIPATPLSHHAGSKLMADRPFASSTPLVIPKPEHSLSRDQCGEFSWTPLSPSEDSRVRQVPSNRCKSRSSEKSFSRKEEQCKESVLGNTSISYDDGSVDELKLMLKDEKKRRKKLEEDLQKSYENCARLTVTSERQWKDAFSTINQSYKLKSQRTTITKRTGSESDHGRNELWIALSLKMNQMDKLGQSLRKSDRNLRRMMQGRTKYPETVEGLKEEFGTLTKKYKELQNEIAEAQIILEDHRPSAKEIVEVTDDQEILTLLHVDLNGI